MRGRGRRAAGAVAAGALAVGGVLGGCGSGADHGPPARPAASTTAPAPSSASPAPSRTAATPAQGPAATAVPVHLRGTDRETIPTDRRVVALTFDGGGSDAAVGSVLRTLSRAAVAGTFFLTGEFARRYPGQVQRIVAAGHRLGNHGDRHQEYPRLTDEEIRTDLARAEDAITAASGTSPRPWFRFPFGARTDADVRVVNDSGYVPVRWTVDTLGRRAG